MKYQIDGSNKTNLATRIGTYLGNFLVATSLLVSITVLAKPAHSEPLTHRAEVHLIFYFYPKYEYRNCTVSIRYTEEPGSWMNMNETFSDTLFSYLFSEEPAVVGLGFVGKPHPGGYTYLVELADECPRREEIMSAVTSKLNTEYPTVNFKIVGIHPDVPERSPGSELWIDSEEYDRKNWQRKMDAAGSCKSHLWARLAEFHWQRDEQFSEYFDYVYSLTAAHLMSKSELEIKLVKGRPSNMTEKQKSYVDDLIATYLKQANCS